MRKKRGESTDGADDDSTRTGGHVDPVDAEETADVPAAADDDASGGNDEPFTRYQNSVYRLVSMGGAALVAVIGITGLAIGRTLDPIPPAQFFFIDGILACLLFGWYLLAMRCRLDVAETWVHVATKYGDFHIDRDRVESVEPDLSLRGLLQWSGRPLIIRYRSDDAGDKVKSRKAYGCLPNDAQTQQRAVEELQQALGRPDESRSGDLEDAVADRLAGVEPVDGQSDLADAVAARLATMEPEGDDKR